MSLPAQPPPNPPFQPTPVQQPPFPTDLTWRWYHIVLAVYGAWLYGDRRGFRTRHHRQHVEGDYKNPPPRGRFAALEQRSRESLKQPPVTLSPVWREVIGTALRDRFMQLGSFVLCIAVARQHVHLLAKTPRRLPRVWSGHAKRHAWFFARDYSWQGKLWAKRGKPLPVVDRRHQLNVYQYILRHLRDGAWVWDWMEHTKDPSGGASME